MEYSKIDWTRDFAWETVVASSNDYPVNPVLWNRLMPELRRDILAYMSWSEEMAVFETCPLMVHPWAELIKRYGLPRKQVSWYTEEVPSHVAA
jgi:hypothetical protein